MKKLFTLLTLLCAVTGVWAQVTLVDVDFTSSEWQGATFSQGNTSTPDVINGISFYCKNSSKQFSVSEKGLVFPGSNMSSNNYYFGIPLSGVNGSITVTLKHIYDSNKASFKYLYKDGDTEFSTNVGNSGTSIKDEKTSDVQIVVTIESLSSNNGYLYIGEASSSYTTLAGFTVTTEGANDNPAINVAASAAITATEAGVEATENIGIKGVNLTGSKLTATLSPAVEGLTVTLDEDAIVDGTIATQAVLHYTATENAKGTTTLTLSDGTTSKEVAISYTAMVTPVELQTVSGTVTWDISTDITGDVQFAEGDRDERVYANIPGLEFKSTFDATTLAFAGEWAFRAANSCAQNGTLHLIASAPGTVEVTFSNTGGSNKNRFVKVTCGEAEPTIGKVEADGTTKRTEKFDVVAGDVYIAGYTPDEGGNSALRFFKVVYTEGDTTGIQTVNNNAANNGVIYNLAGQRVMNAQKGLFIINGNKVVIK